jgi:hypothetical protein
MRSFESQKGLDYNKPDNSRGNPKYRLSEDEVEVVNNYRRLVFEGKKQGIDPKDIKHGWVKSKDASLFFKNPNFNGELDKRNKFQEELLESVKEHAPKYKKIKRKKCEDGHLLIIDPADVHIGKLCTVFETGQEYNSQIAVKRCLEGVEGIINKSYGWNIDKIVLVGGNDILHVDNAKNTTTSGTFQDTSGMWYENFLLAKQLYVDIIEILMNFADVSFVYNPSNHDYTNGFFLCDIIKTHFRKSKNVEFDTGISHRKYFTYGNSLIGTTHGDGAKNTDLGSLMSVECKEDWANSDYRYFYTHHVHHKTAKDFINVTVESLRSPSPADSWHHRNGYVSKPAIEGFIHSKTQGQVARLTNYL